MKALDIVALVLLIVGGLNWGLVGLFKFDLVQAITMQNVFLSSAVYTLVGLAAVYHAAALFSMQKRWSGATRFASA